MFCISITFNNPIKVYFSNKKYLITIQTRSTQFIKVCFLLKKKWILKLFFLKIIDDLEYLLSYHVLLIFSVLNKTLKARNSTSTHTNF
jgi:hypothetical protein